MSKRAEEKSIVYQLATHGPRVMGGSSILSEEDYKFWNINHDFKAGYEEAEKDLGWHSVEESLPPVDEEVIVLTDPLNLHCFYKIGFAHIVNQEATVDIDGKPYKAVSHNGWNVPGVKYWMPMPILPEEEKE